VHLIDICFLFYVCVGLNIYIILYIFSNEQKILESVKTGNLNEFTKLFTHEDINYKDKDGNTLMIIAAGYGHWNIVKFILDKGANPNDRNKGGVSLIFIASRYGNLEIVKLLLSKGVDPNIKDIYGQTPIFEASMYKHVDVIKQLLSKPVDLKNDFGIIIASRVGFLQIVELLLSKGANPNVKNTFLDSPLIAASEMGHLNVVKLLLSKGANFYVIDKHRKTPIMLASEHGRIHVVDFLLKNGANPNDKDDKGQTSIVLASGAGYKNVVTLLLNSGVKDNIQLAIDKAMKFKHGEIVKLLQSKIKSGGKTRFVRNKIPRRKTQKK
jgi:ankyrin repeat protein